MTRFCSVNFSRYPQTLCLAAKVYQNVLYEDQTHLKKSKMSYFILGAFRDTKSLVKNQLFFVNSFGNALFWFASQVNQFKRQVKHCNFLLVSEEVYLSHYNPSLSATATWKTIGNQFHFSMLASKNWSRRRALSHLKLQSLCLCLPALGSRWRS